jgi:uncharacterized protein YjbK
VPREREVKLRIPDPADFARLRAALPPIRESRQRNHYFDAPGLPLSQAGVLVRVREQEGAVLLTVKRGLTRAPGRIESEEWEVALPGEVWATVRAGRARLGDAVRFEPLDAVAAGLAIGIVGSTENVRSVRRGPGGEVYELDETTFPWGEVRYEVEIESEDSAAALDGARRLLDGLGVRYDTAVETKHERLLRGPAGAAEPGT